jgi:hypothetical protein
MKSCEWSMSIDGLLRVILSFCGNGRGAWQSLVHQRRPSLAVSAESSLWRDPKANQPVDTGLLHVQSI